MTASHFCNNLQDYHEVPSMIGGHIGVIFLCLGILYLVSSLVIIYFIKMQEWAAQRGNDEAVQAVIFPVFVYVLWANAAVNVVVGLIVMNFEFEPGSGENAGGAGFAYATMWAIQHMVLEGVAMLLMQKGLGVNGAVKAFRLTCVWGLFTFCCEAIIYNGQAMAGLVVDLLWEVTLLVFYFCLWRLPLRNLYRRPAAIFYGKAWFFFRLYTLISATLRYFPATEAAGNCMFTLGSFLTFALFEPVVLYYTLLQDSLWWQGIDISEGRRGSRTNEDIRSPLQGVDLNLKVAQTLAESMDNMGISAYSTGKKAVRLLNFAYVSLDSKKLLGSGSFSKVFVGRYRNKKCAVKLIFTLDLTQSVIRRIAAEAQILSKIRHPNIVDIVGVSVLPPSVCILLELCYYGSLADLIHGSGPPPNLEDEAAFVHSFLLGSSTLRMAEKKHLCLSWTDRLYLAVGCARGLAALHTFSTGLCHRDVKSFNFLVDSQLTVKISDLELGLEETQDVELRRRRPLMPTDIKKIRISNISSLSFHSFESSDAPSAKSKDKLDGSEFLANWAAPEVIMDGVHVQASDVYSMGLVLWEILSGLVPYADMKRQDDIRSAVLRGVRPPIPSCFENHEAHRFADYIELIRQCWHVDVESRPTAMFVAHQTEWIWKSSCHRLLESTDAVNDYLEAVHGQQSSLSFAPLWASSRAAEASPFLHEQMASIVDKLSQEDALRELEATGESWLLVLPHLRHAVVWATPAWEEEFQLPVATITGQSVQQLLCFEYNASDLEYQGEGYENFAELKTRFFRELSNVRVDHSKHAVVAIRAAFDSVERFSGTRGLHKLLPALYSTHAFPVVRRSAQSIEIPVAESSLDAADASMTPSSSLRKFSSAFFQRSRSVTQAARSVAYSPMKGSTTLSGSLQPIEMLPQSSLTGAQDVEEAREESKRGSESIINELYRVTEGKEGEAVHAETDLEQNNCAVSAKDPSDMGSIKSLQSIAMIAILFHKISDMALHRKR